MARSQFYITNAYSAGSASRITPSGRALPPLTKTSLSRAKPSSQSAALTPTSKPPSSWSPQRSRFFTIQTHSQGRLAAESSPPLPSPHPGFSKILRGLGSPLRPKCFERECTSHIREKNVGGVCRMEDHQIALFIPIKSIALPLA